MKAIATLLLMVSCSVAAQERQGELPAQSIYHLNVKLTNQSGRQHGLDTYRGQPVLVTLFYASCPAVCPLLIDSVRGLESALDAGQKSQLRVLLISIDPEKDTPQALLELAKIRKIDTARWTLARADAPEVRKIAAILNIQYRKLPDGEFNHSSVITLLDRDGAIVTQSSKLGTVDMELVSTLKAELQRAGR